MSHPSKHAAVPRILVVALLCLFALGTAGAASAEFPTKRSDPSIKGTPQEGQTLQGQTGQWLYDNGLGCSAPECIYTYQWQRCQPDGSACVDIPGAKGFTYTVGPEDVGKRLRFVEFIFKRDCGAGNSQTGVVECNWTRRSAPSGMSAVVGGTPPSAPSAPAAPTAPPATPSVVVPAASAAPGITGLAMVDETLTASRGTWAGSRPVTLILQWQRCDAAGANCQDLGLSGETYKVIRFDVGKTLRVRVTAVNAGGRAEAVSAPTAPVTELKPTAEKPSVSAASVIAPHKLVVEEANAEPSRITRRARLHVSLRVMDTRGFRIEGALVTAVVLPRAAFAVPAEATSGADGLVELTFTPRAKLDLRKLKSVTIVLTARRPGDRLVSPRASVVRLKIPVRPAAKARSAR